MLSLGASKRLSIVVTAPMPSASGAMPMPASVTSNPW